MSVLISKQVAIDAVHENYDAILDFKSDGRTIADSFEDIINALPPAQPEIIRCKDCKYNATSKKCLNPNSFFLVPADDDFCSHAERRTNATD